jgi:TrmH family RNA methyltransferase
MIRTAHGLGAAGLVALPGTAELTNPKVLRASMGAIFRLPSVAASPLDTIAWLAKCNAEVWVAAADGEPVGRTRRAGPVALVVGNEGAGVGALMTVAASRQVGILLAKSAESLNVGVAAGILLYEALRDV